MARWSRSFRNGGLNIMETFSSNLAQINHEKAVARYFGITCGELNKSQITGTLFSVKAPRHFAIGDTAFYRKEEIDRFLTKFVEQQGDGL
ncbi:MAG: hypothetical protein ACI9O6_001436 [Glaciecola sp.]